MIEPTIEIGYEQLAKELRTLCLASNIKGLEQFAIDYHNRFYDDDITTVKEINLEVIETLDFLAGLADHTLRNKTLDEALKLEELTRGLSEGIIRRFFRNATGYVPRTTQDFHDEEQKEENFKDASALLALNYFIKEHKTQIHYVPSKWNMLITNSNL